MIIIIAVLYVEMLGKDYFDSSPSFYFLGNARVPCLAAGESDGAGDSLYKVGGDRLSHR
jgi:hypothetical protein